MKKETTTRLRNFLSSFLAVFMRHHLNCQFLALLEPPPSQRMQTLSVTIICWIIRDLHNCLEFSYKGTNFSEDLKNIKC